MSVDINISNYEEFLLSYIDEELNNEERTALEAFLQQHPQLAKELEVLKAAILQPDEQEVFDNKEMLYHSTTITLDNYEGFLLSYIDDELNEAERTALEAFLKKHPHLAQELEVWQGTRLQAGNTLQFEQKEMLYRHTGTLTLENYETYLLSYIDGELNAAEEQTLQRFLQQHPQLQVTLQLLQRTRLQPDPALQMPGKAALYRKTATRATIRPAWWWGAAAAVVAGCLLWLLPARQHVNEGMPPIAATSNKAPSANTQNIQKVQPATAAAPVIAPAVEDKAPVLAANTPAAAKPHRPSTRSITPAKNGQSQPTATALPTETNTGNNNNNTALAQLPQPRATSAEVVRQHLEKKVQPDLPTVQETTIADKAPVLAANINMPHAPAPEKTVATPAPVQGELIMSVTSSSESKLLNGVTSVARFFSRKKNHNK